VEYEANDSIQHSRKSEEFEKIEIDEFPSPEAEMDERKKVQNSVLRPHSMLESIVVQPKDAAGKFEKSGLSQSQRKPQNPKKETTNQQRTRKVFEAHLLQSIKLERESRDYGEMPKIMEEK